MAGPLDPGGRVSQATLDRLCAAIEARDRDAAEALADDLARAIRALPELPEDSRVDDVLDELRRFRCFNAIREVAEAAVDVAPGSYRVRRQLAQSLIENGQLVLALNLLQSLAVDTEGEPENAEAWGLIGRVHKQAYVDGRDPTAPRYQRRLALAAEAYARHGVPGPDRPMNRWHAINLVALLYRAEQDGVSIGGIPDRADLANLILTDVDAVEDPDEWDLATAMEAAVGLGDFDLAYRFARRLVEHDGVHAFEIASPLRQLTEVWGLDRQAEGPGQTLVNLLRASLFEKENGVVSLPTREILEGARSPSTSDRRLQKVLGDTAYYKVRWLLDLYDVTRTVAQLGDGELSGSGFLMRASDLGFEDDARIVLVTNNHVLASNPDPDDEERPMHMDDAEVFFETAVEGGFRTGVAEILFESAPGELDVTVAVLTEVPDGVRPLRPVRGTPRDSKTRLYTVGHPDGGDLSISLQDNRLLATRRPLVHYRTPTAPGSSGGPVFNGTPRVVAVHRAGGPDMPRLDGPGQYEANEGVLIGAVIAAIQNHVA